VTFRKFQPENKLAKVLDDNNGMLVSQAVQRASANVASVRDELVLALDRKLDQLVALAAVTSEARAPDHVAQLYLLARDVMADAGMAGLEPMSRAGRSLCDLLSVDDHPRLWVGIAVHIDGINALRRLGRTAAGPGVEAMLAGLEGVSRSQGLSARR
jgi:hypothetical protein